jgi:GAF domain-containing protein
MSRRKDLLALAHGLQACWSMPILSSAGRVLGTFAIYYREPRSPTPQDHNLIDQITHLASMLSSGSRPKRLCARHRPILHTSVR